jgi:hypothetical protein
LILCLELCKNTVSKLKVLNREGWEELKNGKGFKEDAIEYMA